MARAARDLPDDGCAARALERVRKTLGGGTGSVAGQDIHGQINIERLARD